MLSLSQAKLALSSDPLVRSALEYKIKQSSSYAKKLSSVTQTNKLVSPILESSHLSPSQQYSYAKKQIKWTLNNNLTSFYEEKFRPLLVQGSFLKLSHLENSDSDWLSLVYSLPRGLCLKKRFSSLCPHCNNRETLHHILNFCSVFLNQGRYTWRHNSGASIILFLP